MGEDSEAHKEAASPPETHKDGIQLRTTPPLHNDYRVGWGGGMKLACVYVLGTMLAGAPKGVRNKTERAAAECLKRKHVTVAFSQWIKEGGVVEGGWGSPAEYAAASTGSSAPWRIVAARHAACPTAVPQRWIMGFPPPFPEWGGLRLGRCSMTASVIIEEVPGSRKCRCGEGWVMWGSLKSVPRDHP